MMNIVTCPFLDFQGLLRELAAMPERPIYRRIGRCRHERGSEWLIMPVTEHPNEDFPMVEIVQRTGRAGPTLPWPPHVVAQLAVGADELAGTWWGLAQEDSALLPLHELRLVGAGLHRLPALSAQPALLHAPFGSSERWSRTIGALGGPPIWQRLARLRVAVVGCGRSGSIIAEQLVRLGVADLLLIDPDRVELHNVGEMALVTPVDVGRPKPLALAAHLEDVSPTIVAARTTPLDDVATRAAAARADLLVVTVDNDSARLSAAVLATLYRRLLLDIGTGVHGVDAGRELGADVRLIVPGDGCLRCCGSVADDVAALRGPLPQEWRRERAGSLASLNHLAVATAIRLLEDLAAARVRGSRWLQLRYDAAGELAVSRPPWSLDRGCSLCARSGEGDAAFASFV